MTEADAIRIPVAVAAPLLGISARTLQRHLDAGKYDAIRNETDRRAPFLVLLSSLPEEAQKKYQAERGGGLVPCRSASTQLAPLAQTLPEASAEPDPRYGGLWAWYDKLDTTSKENADAALRAVIDFHDARKAGVSVGMASAAVTQKHGISAATLWRYRNDVDGHPRGHWLPLLAPRYRGNGQEAEFTEEAYEWILNRHLTQSKMKTSVLVRLAREEGAGNFPGGKGAIMSFITPSLSSQANYIESLAIAANLVLSGAAMSDRLEAETVALNLMSCAELIAKNMKEYCDKSDL